MISRSNLALTAAAVPQPAPAVPEIDHDRLAASPAPAVVDETERRAAARAEIESLSAGLDPGGEARVAAVPEVDLMRRGIR
ncbi:MULTISPECIES: hypothetical protein [Streptosporangium]|uniref:Uncharacterized protein n=1 Tax=Streptosporangium brasiliense TaxID=47480 RepID=A0ABT9RIL3_9ACTN|nr:hypothetical protein [Streptosporangium brasiliense]MDP9869133.1 hypothetical protein [Streptosporangium brasiliense]